MKKRTIALLVAGGLLLCLLALREIGAVDANLYKLALSSSQVAAMADKVVGGEKHFSYRLTLKCGDKTLDGHQHFDNDLPSIDIEATLDEPVYTGNCAL